MKINFPKFKKEKKLKKQNFDVSVNFYWKLSLYISLFVIIVAFIFGTYLFLKISKDFDLPTISTSGQIEKVKKERIDGVLNYFLEKEQKAITIINSVSPVVDPSK